MDLAEDAYRTTALFPDSDRFGLIAQMRRSAVSVASNTAEGFGRGRKAEFKRFLEIARGSLFEFQTQAELARRLGWIQGEKRGAMRDLTHQVDAVLSGLIRSIRA
jgi:four helix bundle protein